MRVGWLVDKAGYVGGAELTEREFRAAADTDVTLDDIEIIDCPTGNVTPDCDLYVVHNCVTYTLKDLQATGVKPVFKYWNDVGSWYEPEVRAWLDNHATPICCSPIQQDYMGFTKAHLIPPPVNLSRFEAAAAKVNGSRKGAVSVGSWRNLGKGPHRVLAWAEGNNIDFYGSGPFAPTTSKEVAYEGMPALLAHYETFVFLPVVIEPFGRSVAEAWAAGCEIVTNDLVGAKYWITENPDALRTAASDFWKTVLS